MGLNFLGRQLRRSRDVWRFRLRNDAALAARQTRRFDAVEILLQLLSLGAERRVKVVGESHGPPAASPFHNLSVEIPAVFAVLFEAAKAKYAGCDNRVRFSQTPPAFGGSTRRQQGT